jgi:hypothetical protein
MSITRMNRRPSAIPCCQFDSLEANSIHFSRDGPCEDPTTQAQRRDNAAARSAAMKMVGQKTESIYCRYAIADSVVLTEATVKLAALQATESAETAASNVGAIQQK